MKSKGVSGFGVIFIILFLMVIGYAIYQIARIHFTYGSIGEKVKESAELGLTQIDYEICKNLIDKAKELNVQLDPDSVIIDHGIPDSFRIYVAYTDSTKVLGFYTYVRHFIADKVAPIKVRF